MHSQVTMLTLFLANLWSYNHLSIEIRCFFYFSFHIFHHFIFLIFNFLNSNSFFWISCQKVPENKKKMWIFTLTVVSFDKSYFWLTKKVKSSHKFKRNVMEIVTKVKFYDHFFREMSLIESTLTVLLVLTAVLSLFLILTSLNRWKINKCYQRNK